VNFPLGTTFYFSLLTKESKFGRLRGFVYK
jgi:hypothetical protein